MNPFVKIEFNKNLNEDQKVSVILSSVKNFKQAAELNQAVRDLPQKPAFYGLNTSGQFGFAFIDFGDCEMTY